MSQLTQTRGDVLERIALRMPQIRHMLSDAERPFRQLELDSIDFVELLCAIESEFGVRLSDDDLRDESVTIGELAELIEQRRQEVQS